MPSVASSVVDPPASPPEIGYVAVPVSGSWRMYPTPFQRFTVRFAEGIFAMRPCATAPRISASTSGDKFTALSTVFTFAELTV